MSPDISEDLRKSIENALGRSDRLKVFSLIRKHFQNFRDELRQFETRHPETEASAGPPDDAPADETAADVPPPDAAQDAETDDEPAPEPEASSEGRSRSGKKKKPLYAGGTAQDMQQAMRLNVIFSPPVAMNKQSRHREWDKS